LKYPHSYYLNCSQANKKRVILKRVAKNICKAIPFIHTIEQPFCVVAFNVLDSQRFVTIGFPPVMGEGHVSTRQHDAEAVQLEFAVQAVVVL